MTKKALGTAPSVYPSGVVMVTSGTMEGAKNIITLAWAGNCSADPPMAVIAVRPTRHSHRMILDSGEFVINVPDVSLLWATDYCGQVSGRQVDKFARCGLTPVASSRVRAPSIEECPVNIECVVRNTVRTGSHDTIIGEIVAVNAAEAAVGPNGKVDMSRADLIAYGHGGYYALGRRIGDYGFALKEERK